MVWERGERIGELIDDNGERRTARASSHIKRKRWIVGTVRGATNSEIESETTAEKHGE